MNLPLFVNVQPKEKQFGQQTPRRWGWGTPLKKRAATRTKSCLTLKLCRDLSIVKPAEKSDSGCRGFPDIAGHRARPSAPMHVTFLGFLILILIIISILIQMQEGERLRLRGGPNKVKCSPSARAALTRIFHGSWVASRFHQDPCRRATGPAETHLRLWAKALPHDDSLSLQVPVGESPTGTGESPVLPIEIGCDYEISGLKLECGGLPPLFQAELAPLEGASRIQKRDGASRTPYFI